ncbi:MAG: hypothetical protein PHS92_00245 [Candidatus Gracilibacteria bacterium]|nr:hypothetical protein [Candidatus Gracilibacteria bacterium]
MAGFIESLKATMENLSNKMNASQEELQKRASVFNDPIAEKIEWTPLKRGGASVYTYILKEENGRLIFSSSIWMKITASIFTIVGLFILLITITSKGYESFMMFGIISFIFIGIGAWLLYYYSIPIIFDNIAGYHYRGKIRTNFNFISNDKFIEIKSIHAVQVISEYVRGNKTSFYSYEINLVLNDLRRINVIDHGNLDMIKKDAKLIGDYLSIPVWELSENQNGKNLFETIIQG